MEERTTDNEFGRTIKLTRTENGEQNAVEEGAEEELMQEEVLLELPETDDYDEDLVGLTPSQLKKVLEEREKALQEAREECEKLVLSANELLEQEDYEGAEEYFSQALVYDEENVEAQKGVWIAKSRNFSDNRVLYDVENAELLAKMSAPTKQFLLSRVGEDLEAKRNEYREEAKPLQKRLEAAQSERRDAFSQNKQYYMIRFLVAFVAFCLCAVGTIVCATFIVRSRDLIPVYLTIAFGAITLVAFFIFIYFCRKLYVAARLCRENEKLTSTEDGKRLAFLQEELACLDILLDDKI